VKSDRSASYLPGNARRISTLGRGVPPDVAAQSPHPPLPQGQLGPKRSRPGPARPRHLARPRRL